MNYIWLFHFHKYHNRIQVTILYYAITVRYTVLLASFRPPRDEMIFLKKSISTVNYHTEWNISM